MSCLFSSWSFEVVIGLLQYLVISVSCGFQDKVIYTQENVQRAQNTRFFLNMHLHVHSIIYVFLSFLGLFTLNGVDISNDVYAWIIVFVLPINSAINPFLYTLLAIRRQKASFTSLLCLYCPPTRSCTHCWSSGDRRQVLLLCCVCTAHQPVPVHTVGHQETEGKFYFSVVFVLPINPFLYTLLAIRRHKASFTSLLYVLFVQRDLKREMVVFPAPGISFTTARRQVGYCFCFHLICPDKVCISKTLGLGRRICVYVYFCTDCAWWHGVEGRDPFWSRALNVLG